MRKLIVAFTMMVVMALGTGIASAAVPHSQFGAGNSVASPGDGNAHCLPPGQTTELPQCK